MKNSTTVVVGSVVAVTAIAGGILLSKKKKTTTSPPPITSTPSITVNGTSNPVTVSANSTAQYVATGTPGDAVEIFYSSTPALTETTYSKSSLKGAFDSSGEFSASDVLTNSTESPDSFYVGVLDSTTGITGNFVQVTISPESQTCPCGQILVDGVCQTQVPAKISLLPTVTHYLRYNTGAEPNGLFTCGGWACALAPYTDQTCPSSTPPSSTCTTPTIEYSGQGTVTDSSGNPVCGVPITIDSSLTDTPASIPYSFSDLLGKYAGEILVDLVLNDTKTDSNGNFTFTIKYTISSSSTPNCTTPQNIQQNSNSTNFTIGFDIPNTAISSEMQIFVQYTICGSVI